MNAHVSICIPTFQRPELLSQALASCTRQTYPKLEILVGDDSKDDRTEALVRAFAADAALPVRYFRNRPGLGQAENVNRLFDEAQGDRLMLLHDDDLLLEEAVATLDRTWRAHPGTVLCYGTMQLIDHEGRVLDDLTALSNVKYHRTPAQQGPIGAPLWAALVRQVPPNGYLLSAAAARRVRMRASAGNMCDNEFYLRLAQQEGGFHYVDAVVSQYRRTQHSITRAGLDFELDFAMTEALEVPEALRATQARRLREVVVPAVSKLLAEGRRAEARTLYASRHYTWRARLMPKGLAHAFLLGMPVGLGMPLVPALRRVGRLRCLLGAHPDY